MRLSSASHAEKGRGKEKRSINGCGIKRKARQMRSGLDPSTVPSKIELLINYINTNSNRTLGRLNTRVHGTLYKRTRAGVYRPP
jgi:hypothetical protein